MRDVYLNIMRHALLSAHSRNSVTTAEQKQPKQRWRSDDGTEKTKEPEREAESNVPKRWDFIPERDMMHIYTLVQVILELKRVREDDDLTLQSTGITDISVLKPPSSMAPGSNLKCFRSVFHKPSASF